MPIYEFGDVPGFDKILEAAEAALAEPEVVTKMPPMDLSYIRDAGARAVVALAVSAKWNVVRKPTRPLTLIARDGTKLQLATDTSLRFSVFSQRVHAIGRHSQGVTLTDSLIEDIIKTTKLGHSHAKVLRDLPRTKMPPEDELPTPEEIIETFSEPEIPTGNPVEEVDPTIVRVEPTMATGTKGWFYESPLMDTVVRQLVPDGDEQVTYRCKICGLEFSSKRGVGGHYQVHVKAGEAEATNDLRKNWMKRVEVPEPEPEPPGDCEFCGRNDNEGVLLDADGVPHPYCHRHRDEVAAMIAPEPEPPEPEPVADFYTWRNEQVKVDEPQPAPLVDQIANMIRALIFQETEALEAENNRLRQRNESLEASLNALYELLGEIREPRS